MRGRGNEDVTQGPGLAYWPPTAGTPIIFRGPGKGAVEATPHTPHVQALGAVHHSPVWGLPSPRVHISCKQPGAWVPLRHRAPPGDRPRGGTHTGPGRELGAVAQACVLEVGHGSPWAGVKRAPLELRQAQGSHGILLKCDPYSGPWRGLRFCVPNELPGDA